MSGESSQSELKILKVFGILFCVLAVSNFLKPLELADNHGFVFFGQRLSGTANLVAGPLFGLFLAIYGSSIVRLRSIALPMGLAYAVYVIANLVAWPIRGPQEAEGSLSFVLGYATIAIGVSSGAALLLFRNKGALT